MKWQGWLDEPHSFLAKARLRLDNIGLSSSAKTMKREENLGLAERLQVFLGLFKTHSRCFFLYRIDFAFELFSYL